MNEPPFHAETSTFKNRSTGLAIFGALEVLLGCLFLLLVALLYWGQSLATQSGTGPTNYRSMIPSAVIYGVLGIGLVCLGFGSFRCRRWARSLSLILAWSWLLVGLASLISLAVVLPRLLSAVPNGPARVFALVFTIAVVGLMLILVPLSLLLFYRSPHVQATCVASQPQPDWTDACPPPVLALSLWLGFGALTMVTMPLGYQGVAPLFGVLIDGWLGGAFWLALASLWAWLAWGTYRMRPSAWWVLIAALAVFGASSVVTFARADLMEMYARMGIPEQQLRQVQELNVFSGRTGAWWTAGCLLPMLGYCCWVRRYFRPGAIP